MKEKERKTEKRKETPLILVLEQVACPKKRLQSRVRTFPDYIR